MTLIDLTKLDTIQLAKGGHENPDAGLCLMEAVAYVRGIAHTDHPPCVSPILGEYGRSLNDVLPNDRRQDLKTLIPLLPGTADDGLDETRAYLALDWTIRTYTPTWLDLAGLSDEARSLRELRRIVDLVTAQQAGPVVRAAHTKAATAKDAAVVFARDAARDAARAAAVASAWAAAGDADRAADVASARAAARAAAMAAARDAAGAIVRDAGGDAAWIAAWAVIRDAARDAGVASAMAAARDAAVVFAVASAVAAARAAAVASDWADAGDAAWAAARAVLRPTVDQLQVSAIALFGEMITARAAVPTEETSGE